MVELLLVEMGEPLGLPYSLELLAPPEETLEPSARLNAERLDSSEMEISSVLPEVFSETAASSEPPPLERWVRFVVQVLSHSGHVFVPAPVEQSFLG
jgi:hypothetical protein